MVTLKELLVYIFLNVSSNLLYVQIFCCNFHIWIPHFHALWVCANVICFAQKTCCHTCHIHKSKLFHELKWHVFLKFSNLWILCDIAYTFCHCDNNHYGLWMTIRAQRICYICHISFSFDLDVSEACDCVRLLWNQIWCYKTDRLSHEQHDNLSICDVLNSCHGWRFCHTCHTEMPCCFHEQSVYVGIDSQ
jgi:hypothetical protein